MVTETKFGHQAPSLLQCHFKLHVYGNEYEGSKDEIPKLYNSVYFAWMKHNRITTYLFSFSKQPKPGGFKITDVTSKTLWNMNKICEQHSSCTWNNGNEI